MKKYRQSCSAIQSAAITAAESDDVLDTTLDSLGDDFEYITMSIQTLAKRDAASSKDATAIASELRATLDDYITRIAERLS